MTTQNQQIKAYLTKGKSITPLDALNKFGCFRLSARIKNLRDEGLKIATKYVTKDGKTFASYSVI
ncbi:Helix-turn-helix domain containing protein [uncultured Caudovirales phage]|uniref:Helix-turn-helix domain containing protein n=1 Tax=uncultured Caudovirales phage TaxID=2100421 RepID=A0A6J7WKM8_9CAUD|nr:Helix-turn-helix domain containing protein [uncultured Caudovirales phage]